MINSLLALVLKKQGCYCKATIPASLDKMGYIKMYILMTTVKFIIGVYSYMLVKHDIHKLV